MAGPAAFASFTQATVQVRSSLMERISESQEVARVEKRAGRQTARAEASLILPDGSLVEMIFDPRDRKTRFAVCRSGEVRYEDRLPVDGQHVVPYSPGNNLLRHGVVLLPSEAAEYSSEAGLIDEIRSYLHRYVDLTPAFETVAAYYVLFTWVYDAFNELPYLRVRGDPGSGKSRFLLTLGSLSYKPIFASGASTISPLFRIMDAFRGTLVLDESDFRLSDEKAEVVKILNNGNARGFPVLRSEVTGRREYNPTAYAVFGPKLIATRGFFEDRALESRCLTEEMGHGGLRVDIPISRPAEAKEEALRLRNQLLLFRFRTRDRKRAGEELVDRSIEPRLNQVFVPLLSIVDDPAARAELKALARQMNRQAISDRGLDMEANILEVIRDLVAGGDTRLAIADVTRRLSDRFSEEYGPLTAKRIGTIVRKKLHLSTQKNHGVFVIPPAERPKLVQLYEKYGLAEASAEAEPSDRVSGASSGDLVDIGDVAADMRLAGTLQGEGR